MSLEKEKELIQEFSQAFLNYDVIKIKQFLKDNKDNKELVTKLLLDYGTDPHFINQSYNKLQATPTDLDYRPELKNIFMAHLLQNFLDDAMYILQKKRKVLEKLFSSKTEATNEDRMILDAFVTETASLMPFMLELKSHSRSREKRKGEYGFDYQPLFLKGNQNIINFENYLTELIKKKQPFLFDCIYSGGKSNSARHCQPVQIYYDGKSKPIIYTLDAASGFPVNNDAIHDLKNAIGATIKLNYASRQNTRYGCPIFALQDLNVLSNMTIEEKEISFREVESLDPESGMFVNNPISSEFKNRDYNIIDPRFLKNSQNVDTLKDGYNDLFNKTINKDGNKTLKDHIDAHSVKVGQKIQNKSMDEKMYKYVLGVNNKYGKMLENDPDKAMEIYNSRFNFENKNTFYYSNALVSLIKKEAKDSSQENLQNLLNSIEIKDHKVKLVQKVISDLTNEQDSAAINKIIETFPEEEKRVLREFLLQKLSKKVEIKDYIAPFSESKADAIIPRPRVPSVQKL